MAGGEEATTGTNPRWYWTPTGARKDLSSLVANLPHGVTLSAISAISRKGLIAGFDSQGHPFLLTPVVASSPNNLLLLD